MEPAQTIIKKFGGPSAVAEILGIHRTRVSSWQRSRASGGTDGRIPQGHIQPLLAAAEKRGIPLKLGHFFAVERKSKPKSQKKRAA